MHKTIFIALFILVLTACSSTQVTPATLPASTPTLTLLLQYLIHQL